MDVQQGKSYRHYIMYNVMEDPQRLSDCVGVSIQANGMRKIPL